MILIDAIFIDNKGGGKILLDLLIKNILQEKISVFFLLDKRLEDSYPDIKENVIYLPSSLRKRHLFYLENKNKFSSVLTFANVPPTIRLNCIVYTYFQNVLFFNTLIQLLTMQFKLGLSLSVYFKGLIIKKMKVKTNYWVVQSPIMKDQLADSFSVKRENVLVYPIYNDEIKKQKQKIEINYEHLKFLYVSTGGNHKNHFNLLRAFSRYAKIYPKSSLTLTVEKEYTELYNEIISLQQQGISIINKEYLSKELLDEEYKKADVFVFPSLRESFGLGLIEAAQYRLPILASDLPYVKELVKPSASFNPNSIDDIYNTLIKHNEYVSIPGEIILQNELGNLIQLLAGTNKAT